jgi:hypothetical protein
MLSSATTGANIIFLLKTSARVGSLDRVRVVLIMNAGRTRPLVKVQSLSSCVPLAKSLLLGRIGPFPFNLCKASKRRLIILEKSRIF